MSETGKPSLNLPRLTSQPDVTDTYGHSRIAFVQAGWHQDIVEQSRLTFIQTLAENGVSESRIDLIEVPGSLEIPLQCQMLANTEQYDLIVAAGLIVDGGIYRHEFVAATVLEGIMRVQLDTNVPILSVVLTPHHFNDQQVHQDFFFDHFQIKGREAAQACLQTLRNRYVYLQNKSSQAA